ncbi:hypothetical protein [Caenimonas sp. SL110]|uniref:hypothetical protein n=1 Tax=Caenimonas sp. SL110 TaxID=1450524 RepID=UPI00351066E8
MIDALRCLEEFFLKPEHSAGRWVRTEAGAAAATMVVGATFKTYARLDELVATDVHQKLPEWLIRDNNLQGGNEWWTPGPHLLDIRLTMGELSGEFGLTELELLIDQKKVLECKYESESIVEDAYLVKLASSFFGDRVCKYLNELDGSVGYDRKGRLVVDAELVRGPLRLRRPYLDETSGDLEAAVLRLADLLLGLVAGCLVGVDRRVAFADRGLIHDDELSVVQARYWNPTDPPMVALQHLGKKASPSAAIRVIALSFLEDMKRAKSTQQKKHRPGKTLALKEVVRRALDADAEAAHAGSPDSRFDIDESLHQFVNRCLSDHLFIDQGFQIAAEIFEIQQAGVKPQAARKAANPVSKDGFLGYLVTCFLIDKGARRLTFEDVGTGISCVVPVLCKLHGQFSFSQQPELHLHPALQSALGDVLVERAQHPLFRHVVETHSEYVLLRCLRRIRETSQGRRPTASGMALKPDQICVLYFDPQPDGATRVREIRVSSEGDFIDHWPRGFFEERGKELFDE